MSTLIFKNKLFSSILKDINEDFNENENKCGICLKSHNDTIKSITISCGHKYHLSCLSSLKDRECPYCRTKFSLLVFANKCEHILTRGKNMGKKCNILVYNNNNKCTKHNIIAASHKKNESNKKKVGLCNAILKTGKRKGEICNAKCICLKCKRHSNISEIVYV